MSNLNNINVQDFPDNNNEGDFYTNFRQKLNEVEQFPSAYTFKFIVKADAEKIEQVKSVFTSPDAQFTEKESSGGKYKSISVALTVKDAEDVIQYYKQVSEIESVIML